MFLHTSWRSGGTWLWGLCRAEARVRAFYEPLHEDVGRLREADIQALRPDAWRSNHAATAPYFEEYRALIAPGGRGVPGYAPRFAFDDFFREPEAEDPELEAYVTGLLAAGHAHGAVPVLKFCRSLGRTAWFERRFPAALHAVVLRDPAAQFHSIRQLQQNRNRYFSVAPILVLARNAQHPAVRQACDALGLRLPELHSHDMAYGVETVWRHIRRQDEAERYRGFLAFWTLSALWALRGEALLIDLARLADSPAYRAEAAAALGAPIGALPELMPRPASSGASLRMPGQAAAHGAATHLAQAYAGRLRSDRLAWVLSCLDGGDLKAHFAPPSRTVRQPVWTAAAVAYARALQPVRRLHGKLVKNVLF